MKIYNYNPITFEYTGSQNADLDPQETKEQGKNVYLLPAFNRANASFRLAVKGGALCEAVIENRTVKRLTFTFRDGVEPKRFRVYLDGIEIAY